MTVMDPDIIFLNTNQWGLEISFMDPGWVMG